MKSFEPKNHISFFFWAISIVVATLGVFYKFILPTYEKIDRNLIAEQQTEITQLAKRNSELIAEQKDQLNKVAEEKGKYRECWNQAVLDNASLRQTLQELRPGFFFQGGPYPSGWENVKIGDPVEILTTQYPEKDYTSEPADIGDYISIQPKSPAKDAVITAATYYYEENAQLKKIRQILFHTTKNQKIKALEPEELIKVFGRTNMERKETKKSLTITWLAVQGININIRYDRNSIFSTLVDNPDIFLNSR